MLSRSSPLLLRLPLLLVIAVFGLAIAANPALAGEDDTPPPPCGTVDAGDDCTPVPTATPTPVQTPAPAVTPAPTPAPVAPKAEKAPAKVKAPKPRVIVVTRTVTVPVVQRVAAASTTQVASTTPVGGVAAGAGGTAIGDGSLTLPVAGLSATALLLLLGGLGARRRTAARGAQV